MPTLQADPLGTGAALVDDEVGGETLGFEVGRESLSIAKLTPVRVVRASAVDYVGRTRIVAIVVRNVGSETSDLCVRASAIEDLFEEFGSYIHEFPISWWENNEEEEEEENAVLQGSRFPGHPSQLLCAASMYRATFFCCSFLTA